MDFLDSLDLDTTHKKSHRVRSWYLYEQFKSLERNQLEAVQKLKDKSYQEKILRREISERKARRKLYDQIGLCQSDTRIERSVNGNSAKSSLIMSLDNDDFFETFSEYQDEEIIHVNDNDLSDGFSQDDSVPDKSCMEDFKSVEDLLDENSYAESINSVVENVKSNETICDQRQVINVPTMNIAKDMNKQFDEVKENIQFLENLTKFEDDDDKISEDGSESSVEKLVKEASVDGKIVNEYENNLIAIWSKLVSFAYQVVQLNRGNCYYDYSSQFLTAVLACDVLRRGVNRMGHILQPYVSPIKFANDESDVSSGSHKNVKRKKCALTKKCRKTYDYKLCPDKTSPLGRKYSSRKYSEDCWQHFSELEDRIEKRRRLASEPPRSIAKMSFNKVTSSSIGRALWQDLSKDTLDMSKDKAICTRCRRRAVNPMLKIASYIDSLLEDIDGSKHM